MTSASRVFSSLLSQIATQFTAHSVKKSPLSPLFQRGVKALEIKSPFEKKGDRGGFKFELAAAIGSSF
jgi:hypothetical protein